METLREYIRREYRGHSSDFARDNGVSRQQVQQWLKNGFMVDNYVLYSKRRDIFKPNL